MDFKDVLKELRHKKGISQTDLAKELGLTQKTIALYEVGKREPSYMNLQKIKQYFHVSEEYLSGKTVEDRSLAVEYKNASEKIFYTSCQTLLSSIKKESMENQSIILDCISVLISILSKENTPDNYYDLYCTLLLELQRYDCAISKKGTTIGKIDMYRTYSNSITNTLFDILKMYENSNI